MAIKTGSGIFYEILKFAMKIYQKAEARAFFINIFIKKTFFFYKKRYSQRYFKIMVHFFNCIYWLVPGYSFGNVIYFANVPGKALKSTSSLLAAIPKTKNKTYMEATICSQLGSPQPKQWNGCLWISVKRHQLRLKSTS